jgi:hypothetical protein
MRLRDAPLMLSVARPPGVPYSLNGNSTPGARRRTSSTSKPLMRGAFTVVTVRVCACTGAAASVIVPSVNAVISPARMAWVVLMIFSLESDTVVDLRADDAGR